MEPHYTPEELAASGIYKITNTATQRSYIGRTTMTFSQRWKIHVRSLRRGKHFCPEMQADWSTHGAGAFRFDILEVCTLKEDIAKRERYWLDGMLAKCLPEETYNTMRASRKARTLIAAKKQRAWTKKRERRLVIDAETQVAHALARLVVAEEIDLTKVVKIGAGKKSGEGYQKWSGLVKAAIEEQKETTTTPIANRTTSAKFASDLH
jgi:group I intron endonuclease